MAEGAKGGKHQGKPKQDKPFEPRPLPKETGDRRVEGGGRREK